jgi:tetratricopeptide (TPR) repeat protein
VRTIGPILAAVSVCFAETSPEKLIETGHWKRARAIVDRRLHDAPDDPNASFLSSQIRNAFGDRTSPLELAEKAVRLDGRVARYHRQVAEVQGVMAQHAGIFQQAVLARRFRKEIDTAIELDPADIQALRDLLEFYLLAPGLIGGDSKKADAVAQRIAAINPCEGFLAKARIADFRKDAREQQRMLRSAADATPRSYKAQIALAEFHLVPGHHDEATAEALAKTAIAMDSGRSEGYCILAAIYAAGAKWDALEELLSSASEAVPDNPAHYYRAAERLLADNREPVRAERYLRTYLAQDPEGNQPTAADAHWKLGLALRAQGQDAAAVREWTTATKMDPESPAARELKRNRNGGSNRTSNTEKTGGAK